MGFLDGYRVLDLTDERGLLAARLLADLGADVVAVEPPGGSTARACPPFLDPGEDRSGAAGPSLLWDAFAANKRGIIADVTSPEGRDLIRGLAARADFLIESARPGEMAELGLDWPDLRVVNPALVYVSVTAFGRTGPKAHYAESDLIVWAAGGPLDPHRDPRRGPVRISLPQAFLHAAADAAAGALIAHRARLRTGRGQHVDVSAQASLGIATLGRVLAYAVGDDHPEWDRPAGRIDQSGSGTATDPVRKKWECRDGLVELHLGVGPATGGFTTALFGWLADEGQPGAAEFAALDWRQVPSLTETGTFTPADLDRARSQVAAFLATRTKAEILRAALDRKLLCVPIYDTADIAGSPQLADRGFWADVGEGARRRRLPGRLARVRPDRATEPGLAVRRPAPLPGEHTAQVRAEWLACSPAPPAPAEPGAADQVEPLSGLKMLDLTWVVAGPAIGRSLADFGATVVRVESSRRIETARHMQPFHGGKPGRENSALYGTCNAGKLGMTIDLAMREGRDIVRDLIGWCDVVAEAFSPGLMGRWGLDYERLSATRPDLIMISTSIMGQTGPAARLAGYGNVGAALSGFQAIAGWPDQPPLGPFGPYTDYVGPRLALVTLLAALDHRRRTGQGCYIDVSQVEAGVFFQSPELADHFAQGTIAARMGNADRQLAPHGVYRCRPDEHGDRFVAIAAADDAAWLRLAAELARPDLAGDAALATAAGRRARQDELDRELEAWTRPQAAEEVERRLQAVGVAAHVSSSSRDFCTDPQLAHRGHLVTLPHPLHGSTTVEGPRYLLSETPGRVRRAAPTLGQDNEHVLTSLLGYAPDHVADLTAAGVLS